MARCVDLEQARGQPCGKADHSHTPNLVLDLYTQVNCTAPPMRPQREDAHGGSKPTRVHERRRWGQPNATGGSTGSAASLSEDFVNGICQDDSFRIAIQGLFAS
jgi:hypothetical protein